MQIKDFVAQAKAWENQPDYEQVKEAEIVFVGNEAPNSRIHAIATRPSVKITELPGPSPRRTVYFFETGTWRAPEHGELD